MTTKKTSTKFDLTAVDALLAEVRAERVRHLERFGVQTHPSSRGESSRRQYALMADYYKEIWDAQFGAGKVTWDVVLLEEVYEAVSEIDPLLRMVELVQVAAVALAEAEAIEMRLDEEYAGFDRDPYTPDDDEPLAA